jgi:hypothetical protein
MQAFIVRSLTLSSLAWSALALAAQPQPKPAGPVGASGDPGRIDLLLFRPGNRFDCEGIFSESR